VRGLKLLILFTLLNLLINLTGIGNPDKVQPGIQRYMNTLFEVYVSGEPRYASFQILLPIAYLLIAAPVFLALRELRLWLFAASVAMALASSLSGIESVNLEFMTLGALGISGGMLTNTLNHSFAVSGRWTIIGGLLVSIALMKFLSANLATYALGTMIILKLLYDLGKAVRVDGGLARILVLLGQYSLLCYIAQIIFMQVLYRGLSRPRWELGYEVAIIVFVTVVFLVLLSAGVAKLRDRYRFADKAYNLIFL